jgi:alanine racemase
MPLQIIIDKKSLLNNIKIIKEISGCEINPVLKLNAYGHGIKEILSILQESTPDINRICVAYTHEAITCIQLGWKKQILILGDSINIIDHPQCEYVLLNKEMLESILKMKKNYTCKIHIKCNVGLNRFGFSINEISHIMKEIKQDDLLEVVGICTHLPRLDFIMTEEIENQITQYHMMQNEIEKILGRKVKDTHIFGSKGINLIKKYNIQCNVVRTGGALYGLLTTEQLAIIENDFPTGQLKQVMTLQTPIMGKRIVEKNEYIGYGLTGLTSETTYLLICDCGYGYGFYPSNQKDMPAGLYKNEYLYFAAGIAMNNIFLKISKSLYEDIQIGDYITLSSQQDPSIMAANISVKNLEGRAYMYTATLNNTINKIII